MSESLSILTTESLKGKDDKILHNEAAFVTIMNDVASIADLVCNTIVRNEPGKSNRQEKTCVFIF